MMFWGLSLQIASSRVSFLHAGPAAVELWLLIWKRHEFKL